MSNELKLGSKLILLNGYPIRLPAAASDPVGQAGDLYFNTSSNRVRIFNGTVWQDMASGSISLTNQPLNDGEIIVGDNTNESAAVDTDLVGDINADHSAGLTIKNDAVVTDKIADDAVTKAKVNADVAGDGLGQALDGSLKVNVDDSTVELNSDALRVKDLGITTAKLADDAVTKAKLDADVAGNGLSQDLDGSLKVNVDDSTLEINADSLRVKDDGITKDKINADVAGDGLGQALDGSLKVNVDNSSIEVDADALKVKALGIQTGMLADDAVTKEKVAADVAGDGIGQAIDGSLKVNVDGSTIELSADAVQLKDGGITNAKISASADIAYSKLANLADAGVEGKILISDGSSKVARHSSITSDKLILKDGSVAFTANQSMGGNKLTNLAAPTDDNDAARKKYVDDQDALKVSKAGDSMSGNLDMGANKITNLAAGTSSNDAVNKAQLDAAISGLFWLDPVLDPDMVEDTNTIPLSPVSGATYLAKATVGAWTVDHIYYYDGSAWVDALGRAVQLGDRFVVSMYVSGAEAGSFAGKHNQIAQISGGSSGAWTFTFTAPADQNAVFVSNTLSEHFGHSYTYRASSSEWIEFSGPSATPAGVGLSYSGNTLNINLGAGITELPSDQVGIDVHANGGLFLTTDNSTESTVTSSKLAIKLNGSTLSKDSSGLKVASLGITASEIAADAVTTVKILDDSITNAKMADNSVGTAELQDDSVDSDKLNVSVAGDGIAGGGGSPLSVDHDGFGLQISGGQLSLELNGTTLYKDSSGLKVNALGITASEIASNAVTTAKIDNDAVDKDKINEDVAGSGLSQALDGSLQVNVDGSTIEIDADTLRVKDAGITNVKVATGIDASKLADGSVSNTEFQYINSLSSNAQDQLNDKASRALGNLSSVAINTSLLPASDSAIDLGSTTKKFRSAYVDNVKDSADVVALDVANRLVKDVAGVLSIDADARTLNSQDASDRVQWDDNFVRVLGPAFQRGASALALVEEQYVDSVSLSAASTVTAFSYDAANYCGAHVEYMIKTNSGEIRTGKAYIASKADGSSVSYSDQFSETADCQIMLSADFSSPHIRLRMNNAAASGATMRLDVKLIRA